MKLCRSILLFFMFFCPLSIGIKAAPFNDREYQIKAAFIANFINYTVWQSLPSSSFKFCSTSSRVNSVFTHVLSNEQWFSLKTDFQVVVPNSSLKCDLLFVDKFSVTNFNRTFLNSISTNTLIISENRKAAQLFSHINFFFVDNKLRFEINVERLNQDNLSIHASVLRLARITSHKGGAL